jgi:hypothetical protein
MEKYNKTFDNIKSNIIRSKQHISITSINNLIETNNIVIEDKAFIGFSDHDNRLIKDFSLIKDTSLYVKNNVNILKSIHCNDKIYIGYTNINELNNDTNLHVKGDVEFNGNLYVYDDIVVDNNLYACKSLNVGFSNNLINKDLHALNVNGTSNFKDNLYIDKSILVEENIIVNKDSYLNNIFLNTNIDLEKEIIENIDIKKTLLNNDKLIIIKNIVKSLKTKNNELKGIVFNRGDNTYNNGIASVSKKIIINNKIYNTFMLINFISHDKIKTIIKPIIETFTIIDENFKIVKENFDQNNQNYKNYNNINNENINTTIDTSSNDEIIINDNTIIEFIKKDNNTKNIKVEKPLKIENVIRTEKNSLKNKFNLGILDKINFLKKIKNFSNTNILESDSDDYEEIKE